MGMTTPTPSVEEHLARLEGSSQQTDRCRPNLEQNGHELRANWHARMARHQGCIVRLFYGPLGAIAAFILDVIGPWYVW